MVRRNRLTFLICLRSLPQFTVFLVLLLLLLHVGIVKGEQFSSHTSRDIYGEAMLAITEGRLNAAEILLRTLIAEEPRHAGAWLDLAILYCATGDILAAERLFIEIELRYAPPQPILDVIAHQRKLGCARWAGKTNGNIRVGRGYETNVNQGARNPNLSLGGGGSQIDLVLLPEFRPRGDQFTSLSGELIRDLSENGAYGIVQFNSKYFDKLSDYNTATVFAGAEFPWRWSSWGGRLAGITGFMTLGGEVYLRQDQVQLEVIPPLALGQGWQSGVTGSWSYISYPTLSNFDAQWWEMRGMLSYQREKMLWQANVGAVKDNQVSERPGGDRMGSFANIRGMFPVGNNVLVEVSWQLQHWEGENPYFPGLINVPRTQNISALRFASTYALNECHSIIFEYRNIINQENISIFDYNNQVFQINWQWQPSGQC